MDNKMIERVAEAIYNNTKNNYNNYKEFEPYSELYPRTKSIYIVHAKAAIQAMREPTEKMREAGCDIGPDRSPEEYYNAMIDAILND